MFYQGFVHLRYVSTTKKRRIEIVSDFAGTDMLRHAIQIASIIKLFALLT